MNPLAERLNSLLVNNGESIFSMLSSFGKELFFPKGILAQSQEAKDKADKFNATIGIAIDDDKPFVLSSIGDVFSDFDIKDIVSYAPVPGKEDLRGLWRELLFEKNPSLCKDISVPIVTSGITHGLSIFSDLFLDEGDKIIIPDKFWGNYNLIFSVRNKVSMVHYPIFNKDNLFNVEALDNSLGKVSRDSDKLVVLFNFPNNPTGYTISIDEALVIKDIVLKYANLGKKVIVLMDDSYFNLFYEDSLKESLFAYFSGLHKNILAVKLDAGTKEDYVWGFRTGFITYGSAYDSNADIYNVLEEKTKGAIRSCISNSPHPSQTLLYRALKDKNYKEEKAKKLLVMRNRALKVKEVLSNPRYDSAWSVYPFNSGYFMCISVKDVDAEELRLHLLEKYGTGVVSSGEHDIRIAFSCVEYGDIEKLFEVIYQAVCDLQDD